MSIQTTTTRRAFVPAWLSCTWLRSRGRVAPPSDVHVGGLRNRPTRGSKGRTTKLEVRPKDRWQLGC
eukprot:4586515-Prymnesium_polylepis.1